jgi:hypothetical protein
LRAVDSRIVILRKYHAMIHAELAKSALGAWGPRGDRRSMIHPRETTLDGVALVVSSEDVERALEILGPEEQFSD